MAKREIDTAQVTLDGLTVPYQGVPVGAIRYTGKRYHDGRETIWGTSVNDEIYYSEKAAAVAVVLARKGNGE